MKLVQIGILVALIAVGVLLFMVYRGQQQQQQAAAETVTQQLAPTESVETASPAADAVALQKAPESRPSPGGDRRATKATSVTPAPTEAPVTRPQPETAAAVPAPAVSPAPSSSVSPALAPDTAREEPPPPPK